MYFFFFFSRQGRLKTVTHNSMLTYRRSALWFTGGLKVVMCHWCDVTHLMWQQKICECPSVKSLQTNLPGIKDLWKYGRPLHPADPDTSVYGLSRAGQTGVKPWGSKVNVRPALSWKLHQIVHKSILITAESKESLVNPFQARDTSHGWGLVWKEN